MDNDRGAALLQLVGELAAEVHPAQTPKRSVSLDSTLSREIGLDSLARVELIARIERHFGVSLPEHVFADAETPRDLLAALWRASTSGKSPLTPKIAPIDAVAVGGSVPEMAQTLVEVLNWHVNTEPDRPHIRIVQEQGQEEVITYRALWQESQAVATGLQALGLQGGQAVVIMLPTGREYFLSFFGAILAGGIPVPIYPPARLSQLEDHIHRHRAILANCQAAVLVTVTEAKLLAHLLKAQVDTLQDIVTVEELCRGEPCTLPRAWTSRYRLPAVYLREHRRSQRSGAYPCQPARQHPGDGRGGAGKSRRRIFLLVCPLLLKRALFG